MDLIDQARATSIDLLGLCDIYEERYEGIIELNPRRWRELPDEAQPKVKAARDARTALHDFAVKAIERGAPERQRPFDSVCNLLDNLIEQSYAMPYMGPAAASPAHMRERIETALDELSETLRSLPTAHGAEEWLLVADTSALVDRPDLARWYVDRPAVLVVLPQVLGELDECKRNPRTRDAAQKLLAQLDEFDRRGDTRVGVKVSGKLRYREVVAHPDMAATLPWLRPDIPDDLVIAGALELAWDNLVARITVIASDRGVRNKARSAGLDVARTTHVDRPLERSVLDRPAD